MNEERQPYIEKSSDLFRKYGIEILEDGSVHGPKRPEQFGETPKFTFEDGNLDTPEPEKQFLTENFGKAFSTYEHQEDVLSIVGRIVQSITGSSFENFSNVVIMARDDFKEYSRIATPGLQEDRGISGNFHGISLGGLIIVQDTGGDNCFPLIFHEIGHTMYPDKHDNYVDELRAMYFQILCTKKLERELERIGINMLYPDDYYKDLPLPTDEHRRAFDDARTLFMFQRNYSNTVEGDKNHEHLQQELLKIVKQTTKSFS